MANEFLIVTEILKRFKDSKLAEFFEILPQVSWRTSHNQQIRIDLAFFKKDIIYAVVEVKTKLSNNILEDAKCQVANALIKTNCRFGIITDNYHFFIVDTAKSIDIFELVSFEQIVQYLIKPPIISHTEGDKDNIRKALGIYFNPDEIPSICDSIIYDESQGFFLFNTIENEIKFFNRLMGGFSMGKAVYRYTSLDTLFVMLNKGTYRLNGIVGMNDKSEIDYFDKECAIDNSGSSVRELNKTYLSSCSLLKDDLTMWRLYGDDAKGVCLEFDIVPPEKRYNNFILAPVNYAQNSRKHIELKMLRELSDANVRFVELNKWKHFFKPYDYSVEKEIRLMFLDNGKYDNGVTNRDWVKTWSHSIINPIVEFKLNASGFPIQLRNVIIGPNMPELEINKSQLEDLISSKGYYNINVEISEIDNYR